MSVDIVSMMPAHTLPNRPVNPRTRQLLAAVPALALCLFVGAFRAQPAYAGNAIFSASCLPSHVANDDPIVFPGQPGAAHTHEFSGAWSTNAFSTATSLKKSGSTCDPLEDTGAYWMPALYMKGQRMQVDHTTAYYAAGQKNSDSQRKAIKAFPPDFRMIADVTNSTQANTGYDHAGWLCGSEQVKWGYDSSLTTIKYHCPYGLQARILFPDCWDGKNLDTINPDGTPAVNPVTKKTYPNDHRSHMAYASLGGDCPADHPVGTPRIDLKVNYVTKGLVDSKANRPKFTSASKIKDSTPLDPRKSNEGDSSADFTLAGGNGAAGNPIDKVHPLSSFHADFYNGWAQDKLESLIQYCIRDKKSENDTPPCLHPTLSDSEQAKIDKLRINPNWPNACPITCKPGSSVPSVPPPPSPPSAPGGSDTTVPTAPSNVKASAVDATTVNVSWTAATDNVGVTSYEVRRAVGTAPSAVIATIPASGTSYRDAGAAPGTNYVYKVRAYDAAGNVSGPSNTVSVKTPQQAVDKTAPSAPSNLRATAVSATQVNLAWNASTDSGGSGLRGYNVYRDGGSSALNASPLGVLTFGDAATSASRTYTYQVEAVDGAGNRSAKASVSVTTPAPSGGSTPPPPPPPPPGSVVDTTAPSAPTNLKANAIGPLRVDLTWTAAADNVGVVRYEVRRAPHLGSSISLATIGALTGYSDLLALPGTAYDYKVKAIDAAGNMSPPSSISTVTTPK